MRCNFCRLLPNGDIPEDIEDLVFERREKIQIQLGNDGKNFGLMITDKSCPAGEKILLEKHLKFNFCPMCGRSLKVSKSKRAGSFRLTDVCADYTGGGIWLFRGMTAYKQENCFFLTDEEGDTLLLDSDPEDLDTSLEVEWQEEHKIIELMGEERASFLKSLAAEFKAQGLLNGSDEYRYYEKFMNMEG